MESEKYVLRESIERYRQLLRGMDDERVRRELERMLREAEDRLNEIGPGA